MTNDTKPRADHNSPEANTRPPIPGTVDIRSTYRDTMKRFPKTMELLATTNPMTDRGTEIERVDYLIKMARQYEAACMRVPEAIHGAGERLEQAKRELLGAISAMSSEDEVRRLREVLQHFAKIAELRAKYNDPPGTIVCVPLEMCQQARTALTPNPCGQEES